jgi:hypothetical protein
MVSLKRNQTSCVVRIEPKYVLKMLYEKTIGFYTYLVGIFPFILHLF